MTCAVVHPGTLATVFTPPAGAVLDWDLPDGHFFQQANGFGGAGSAGYAVVDDAQAQLWTEFQRLGGVQRLGYPITSRFEHKGFPTQAFQKMALQWRSDLNQAVPINIYDDLNQQGADAWLDVMRQVPPAPDTSADAGLPFEEVVRRHVALLDATPALAEFYASTPDALETLGLPLAVKSYGPVVSVRLQRATLQLWTVDTPFAAAGSVVIDNAADVAKELGLWPTSGTAAGAPPPPRARTDPEATLTVE